VLAITPVDGESGLSEERKVSGDTRLFHPENFLQLADSDLAFV